MSPLPPRCRPDASRRNARPGLAATDDGKVRAECGERLCRRQPNAIGRTRDQDLLVVHGTAIQGYGPRANACSNTCAGLVGYLFETATRSRAYVATGVCISSCQLNRFVEGARALL